VEAQEVKPKESIFFNNLQRKFLTIEPTDNVILGYSSNNYWLTSYKS
jgi:hypothetical protein